MCVCVCVYIYSLFVDAHLVWVLLTTEGAVSTPSCISGRCVLLLCSGVVIVWCMLWCAQGTCYVAWYGAANTLHHMLLVTLSILGVLYGGLLWADMNTAAPLGAWGRYIMFLAPRLQHCFTPRCCTVACMPAGISASQRTTISPTLRSCWPLP